MYKWTLGQVGKQSQFKPNQTQLKPIQSQLKPKRTQFKPKQTQFLPAISVADQRQKMLLCMTINHRREMIVAKRVKYSHYKWTKNGGILSPVIKFINSEKRYAESCGPGDASGWYWTEKAPSSLHRMPSTVLSFKFTCVNSTFLFWSKRD